MRVRDKLSETHDAVKRIRRVREQIDTWIERFAGQPGGENAGEAGRTLKERMEGIEGILTKDVKELNRLIEKQWIRPVAAD